MEKHRPSKTRNDKRRNAFGFIDSDAIFLSLSRVSPLHGALDLVGHVFENTQMIGDNASFLVAGFGFNENNYESEFRPLAEHCERVKLVTFVKDLPALL